MPRARAVGGLAMKHSQPPMPMRIQPDVSPIDSFEGALTLFLLSSFIAEEIKERRFSEVNEGLTAMSMPDPVTKRPRKFRLL
jgi:hypothetical protein